MVRFDRRDLDLNHSATPFHMRPVLRIGGRERAWLEAKIASGWASCARTENGCILVFASRRYPNALKPSDVAGRLTDATTLVFHQFWDAGPSLLAQGLLKWEYPVGSRQVSDAYLLAPVHHGGRLVTFGPARSTGSVRGATDELLVVL
jgi:uncharacterized protein